jgi:anti-sigma factor RsiW
VPMNCDEMQGLIHAYADEELDVVTALHVDRHLTECPACQSLYRQCNELRQLVQREAVSFRATKTLENSVRASLRAEDVAVGGAASRTSHRWLSWLVPVTAAALIAIATIAIWVLRIHSDSEMLAAQVVSSHIRSLITDHVSDVVSSDRHTVKPWFSGKLDFSPVVTDLSSQGFPLIGGRLDYLDGRPVATLVYRRSQHIIDLFEWPSPDVSSPPATATIKGFNMRHWTESHMTYWAVSDLNAEELATFAAHLQH